MACYIGETETSADTVSFTHALETPWDAQTGQSPLMELCRMVQNRWTALHQGTLTFVVVGANPPDTTFDGINYEAVPAANPFRDFYRVLDACRSAVLAMVVNGGAGFGGVVNSSGYRWRYNNADAVRTALLSDLTGFDFQLQEDWKPIILALRTALESLSGAEVQSAPWVPATLAFSIVPLVFGDPDYPGGKSDIGGLSGGIDPTTVTYYPGDFQHGNTYLADVDTPNNDWPVSFGYAHAGGAENTLGYEFEVGFHVGAALPNDGSFGSGHGDPTSATDRIFVQCDHLRSGGWYILPESMSKSWRIRGNPAWSTQARAAMIGKTATWSITLIGPDTDLPVTATPSGGVLTFSNTAHITIGQVVTSFVEMGADPIPTGAEALAWADQDEVTYAGTVEGPKGCSTQFEISGYSYDFCVDALGVYHDD